MPMQRPEYRLVPMEDRGNAAGGYLAFEMKNPANENIVGVGTTPQEALADLLSKLTPTVHLLDNHV